MLYLSCKACKATAAGAAQGREARHTEAHVQDIGFRVSIVCPIHGVISDGFDLHIIFPAREVQPKAPSETAIGTGHGLSHHRNGVAVSISSSKEGGGGLRHCLSECCLKIRNGIEICDHSTSWGARNGKAAIPVPIEQVAWGGERVGVSAEGDIRRGNVCAKHTEMEVRDEVSEVVEIQK